MNDKQSNNALQTGRDDGYRLPPPEPALMPEKLVDVRCGAKTKATGQPCKRKDLCANGRCKLHAGLSTGPCTEAGKKKSAMNGFKKGWSKQTP